MNSNSKTVVTAGIIALVFFVGGWLVGNQLADVRLAGTTNYDQLDTTEGYSVDSTSVIDGSGNWIGVISTTNSVSVGRFEQGGGITTLTDANGGAFTLTQAHLGGGVLTFAAGGAGQATITITLPATSTLTTIIPNAGDSAVWIYDSTALVAATTTTFAAGTGITLHEPSGGDLVVAGATMATIQCHRKADTDIDCVVIEAQPG